TGESSASVLAAVLRDDPVKASSLAPGLPPALQKILEQCLRKDPARRFRHMGDVRLALEEIEPMSGDKRWRAAPWLRRAAIYGALAAMPVLAGWLALNRHKEPEANSMPVPLTSFAGIEKAAAWSP